MADGTEGTATSRLGEVFSVALLSEHAADSSWPMGAWLFEIGDDYPYEKWRGDRRWFDKRDFSFRPQSGSSGPEES